MTPSLADEIRMCRKEQGLTQEQLAKKADVTVAMINYIENEERTPSIGMLEKIAAALDCNLSIRLYPKVPIGEDKSWKKLLNG